MRRFRRFFAALFIASTLIGALHEVLHDHHHHFGDTYEESCPVYLLNPTALQPGGPVELAVPVGFDEPVRASASLTVAQLATVLRTRAPPLFHS